MRLAVKRSVKALWVAAVCLSLALGSYAAGVTVAAAVFLIVGVAALWAGQSLQWRRR